MELNKIEENVYSKCNCQLLMYLEKVSEAAELMKKNPQQWLLGL